MSLLEVRKEVMLTMEKSMDELLAKYLKSPDTNWQPSDFLPDASDEGFHEQVKEIQELSREMDYDLFVTLIGDTITEEALPTYESWLMTVVGVDNEGRNGWSQWIRSWTAEENRHGDLLNRYLYLSGRVNMREMEISTQHLIADGFDIQTGTDPYRNFIYTSFQEVATNISHRRVASQCKKLGNDLLAKICGNIAADEARHGKAYSDFVQRIFELDPSEMMLAFQDMMKKKIVMPAHFLREAGGSIGDLYTQFSDAAQRINVYTTHDYIGILNGLLKDWKVADRTGLNEDAEKARDFLMALPKRLTRISERIVVPETPYKFSWVKS